MSNFQFPVQDPYWLEVSASLRKGILFVKMPRSKVSRLVRMLLITKKDLSQKKIEESEKVFIFHSFASDWKEDLPVLREIVTKDASGVVQEIVTAIENGLRNDARVDWVSRVGGPSRKNSDSLEFLEVLPGEKIPSLD